MSRRKGLIHEYRVRDLLRKEGWVADRVPSSGAAEGFPGDISASKDGEKLLVEVKARAKSFSSVYDVFNQRHEDGVLRVAIGPAHDQTLVCISRTAGEALACTGQFKLLSEQDVGKRALRALLKPRQFLKECTLLVLHDDRRDYLFITYR